VANRSRRARALLWALLATFACDVGEESTLEIAVRVEPTIQVAPTSAAQLLVGFDSSGDGYVVFFFGTVCGPPTAPFVTTARFAQRAGGVEATAVDAWLVPVAPGVPVTCGPTPTPQPVSPPAARFAGGAGATAQVVVLAGCGAGEVRSATVVIHETP
jgi:hypothetical protein